MLTQISVTCKLATVEYRVEKKIFSLYIVFISVVFTQLLPRTPNHFPLPRLWTRDRDIGPATATLDPRPRHWTRDRDIGPATATFGPATRDPQPATISQTLELRVSIKISLTHVVVDGIVISSL